MVPITRGSRGFRPGGVTPYPGGPFCPSGRHAKILAQGRKSRIRERNLSWFHHARQAKQEQKEMERAAELNREAAELFKKNIEIEAQKNQRKAEEELQAAAAKLQEEIRQKYNKEAPAEWNRSEEDKNLLKFLRSISKE